MKLAHRYIVTLCLTAAVAAPAVLVAAPAAQEVSVKVYDRDHKDYHNWNDNESRHWDMFLTENHRDHHDWKKANKKEQSEYWKWRHNHPD